MTNYYSAHVEVDLRKDVDDHDQLLEQLAPFHAAIGMSEHGLFSAQITVVAETMPQAATVAISVIEAAVGAPVIAIELMTESEFNRREGWDDSDDLVTAPEAARMLGVSRQAIGQRIRAKTLPAERRGRDWLIPRTAVEAVARRAVDAYGAEHE